MIFASFGSWHELGTPEPAEILLVWRMPQLCPISCATVFAVCESVLVMRAILMPWVRVVLHIALTGAYPTVVAPKSKPEKSCALSWSLISPLALAARRHVSNFSSKELTSASAGLPAYAAGVYGSPCANETCAMSDISIL